MDERLTVKPKRSYDTKSPEKILDAAEALIAKLGVGGVTFKQIAIEAGQGNKSSVRYHFGDMASLINAVLLRRHTQVEQYRVQLYEEIERSGRLKTIESCLEIFFIPIIQITDSKNGHVFAKFSLQYRIELQHNDNIFHPGYELKDALVSQKAFTILKELLWYIPDGVLDSRIDHVFGMFLVSILEYDSAVFHGRNVRPWAEFLEDIFGIMGAALKAPLPPR